MALSEAKYNDMKEDDDCTQEALIDPNNDGRKPIWATANANDDIIRCIGNLRIRYADKQILSNPPEIMIGTGTVINIDAQNRCYVLTAAHNVCQLVRKCSKCHKKTIKSQCEKCNGNAETLKPIKLIKPTSVEFGDPISVHKPDQLPCPVESIYMTETVSDKWDATWIDTFAIDKKTIFDIKEDSRMFHMDIYHMYIVLLFKYFIELIVKMDENICKIFQNITPIGNILFLHDYVFDDEMLDKLVQYLLKNQTTQLKEIKFVYLNCNEDNIDKIKYDPMKLDKVLLNRLKKMNWIIEAKSIGNIFYEIRIFSDTIENKELDISIHPVCMFPQVNNNSLVSDNQNTAEIESIFNMASNKLHLLSPSNYNGCDVWVEELEIISKSPPGDQLQLLNKTDDCKLDILDNNLMKMGYIDNMLITSFNLQFSGIILYNLYF